ncbi:hypothetical protein AB1Y20_002736 [Prymnesium parvum]|uniref:Inosine/uridine-preferring nucleoside hydrolase domain-containing protein n=1 Tax=Prymnesium parvum TaxID=97485 RepID=A0AB34J9F2_PRYPA
MASAATPRLAARALPLLATLSLLSPTTAADTPPPRIPVAIVADVGVDDAAALLMSVGSPRLEILGLASSFGCHTQPHQTAANARRLLAAANRSDLAVHVGARFPLGSAAPLPKDGSWIHGPTGFGDGEELGCDAPPPRVSAAEFIVSVARARPGEVTLLCFSPLTDVALAILLEPRLPLLLRSLVIMGGAVYTHGNAQPLAEANFWHDPAAARLVTRSFTRATAPLVIAPLDVTMRAHLSPATIKSLAPRGRAAALFVDAWEKYYSPGYCTVGVCDGTPIHDAFPVAYLLAPHLFTNTTEVSLQVVVAPGTPAHGQSFVDQRWSAGRAADAPHATLLLDVDRDGFVELLVANIARIGAPHAAD